MKLQPDAHKRQIHTVCWLLILVIVLKDGAAHPVPYGRHRPPQHAEGRPQYPYYESPPPPRGPPAPATWECSQPVVVHQKTPQPIFFPYTVTIPWPTLSNGTNFAPVPKVPHTKPPVSEPLQDDSYPLYIPWPQFDYVPLYYNSPTPTPCGIPSPRPSRPPIPVCTPKPPEPLPIPSGPYPPVKLTSKQTIEPISPPSKSPPTTIVIQPPKKLQPTYPVNDGVPPPNPFPFVPPPKHTWVPPPEDISEYNPPTPSILHPRSSASHYDKEASHFVHYSPQYYSVIEDAPVYGPETKPYSPPSPFSPYNINPPRSAYFEPDTYVTFGPEVVKVTSPSQHSANDDYLTYHSHIISYTEDAPVPYSYPARPPYSSNPFSRPSPPPRPGPNGGKSPAASMEKYIRYRPTFYTIVENNDIATTYNPYGPVSVPIAGRSSVFHPPRNYPHPQFIHYPPEVYSIVEETADQQPYNPYPSPRNYPHPQFIHYPPEVYSIVEETADQQPYNPYPSPSPESKRTSQQPTTTRGGSSSFSEPGQDKIGYVHYQPELYHIVEDKHGDQSIVYDPQIVKVVEGVSNDVEGEPVRESSGTSEWKLPEHYVFTDPEKEFFENNPTDNPQNKEVT